MYRNEKTNSSLRVTSPEFSDGQAVPGLVVSEWTSQGQDVKAAAQFYASSTGSGNITSVQLHPSVAVDGAQRKAYRAVFATEAPGDAQGVPRIFDPTAETWFAIDQLVYGKVAVDELCFKSIARVVMHIVSSLVPCARLSLEYKTKSSCLPYLSFVSSTFNLKNYR